MSKMADALLSYAATAFGLGFVWWLTGSAWTAGDLMMSSGLAVVAAIICSIVDGYRRAKAREARLRVEPVP